MSYPGYPGYSAPGYGPPPIGGNAYPPRPGYGAPPQYAPAYGAPAYAPQPVYAAPPVYAAAPAYPQRPGYGAPVYGAPVATGYTIPVPTQPVAYMPGIYQYTVGYAPGTPFVLPVNLPPHLAAKMYQASAAFRMFDTNWSGSLDKREWKRCLRHLGFYLPKSQSKHWFRMVDRDCSGRISEREFCEWWLQVNPY